MKRILLVLVLALAIVGKGLPIEQAKASTFTYCSHYISQGVCEEVKYSLGDFLTALAGENGYYPDSSFEIASDTYVTFKTLNFTYYVPFWVIEYGFDTADYSGGVFNASDWEAYDENLNLIPDDFEDYTEEFEDDYDWYTDTYMLDLWWSNENRLPVVFDYLTIDDGFLYGRYSPGDDDYFDSETPNLQINIFAEEDAIIGTIAHEMFHAVQDGYVDDSYFMFTNSFGEGTAAMIESKLPGSSDLSYMALEDAVASSSPEESVFGDLITYDGDEYGIDGAKYGSFLWYSYLHQYYGKDIIGKMLEAFSDIEDQYSFNLADSPYYSYLAISQALAEEGVDIIDVYGEFAIKNYEQDEYTDGEFLPDLKVIDSHSSNSGSVDVDDDAPELFGSNYIEFQTEGDEGYLTIDFLGNTDALFYVSFIPTGRDGTVDRDGIERYYIDYGELGSMYFPLNENDEVIMVVSPVETTVDSEDVFNDYIFPYSYAFGRSDTIPEDALDGTEDTETSGSIFSDVDEGDSNSSAISYLKDSGIIGGYPDGSFKPENPLNRAELLKILVEGVGIDPDSTQYANCFPDVTTDWYAKYVCYAKEQGWIEGYPDGTFLPASDVNKVEAVKMLLEVFGVETMEPSSSPYSDVATSEWYAKYIVKAEELGLLEETGSYSPSSSITRGGVSENIYRLLIQQ